MHTDLKRGVYQTKECVEGGFLPVGVLLRKEEEGVMGGVTGGVRFPVLWRGGVGTLLRHRPPVRGSDSLGCTFFFTASCSRRAASVTNLQLCFNKRAEFLSSFFFFGSICNRVDGWRNHRLQKQLEGFRFRSGCKLFGKRHYKNRHR